MPLPARGPLGVLDIDFSNKTTEFGPTERKEKGGRGGRVVSVMSVSRVATSRTHCSVCHRVFIHTNTNIPMI